MRSEGFSFLSGGLGAGPCSFLFWVGVRSRSRCARIGVGRGCLGGVLRRCAVGIGGWHVVLLARSVALSCHVMSCHVLSLTRVVFVGSSSRIPESC